MPPQMPTSARATKVEKCRYIQRYYGIVPKKTRGDLGGGMLDTWLRLGCPDIAFTSPPWLKMPPLESVCPYYPDADLDHSVFNKPPYSNHPGTFVLSPPLDRSKSDARAQAYAPLIAVVMGSTTRKIKNPGVVKLSLFKACLPSLINILECGFRYLIVISYDVGDAWWDKQNQAQKAAKDFVMNEIHPILQRRNIHCDIVYQPYLNPYKKPGPVFNFAARLAYDLGADFIHRVNDDTEFIHPWAHRFVKALHSMGPPYGVVGPMAYGGRNDILQTDFVHRTHMEIFDLDYYPPLFKAFYMDDWITHVYGWRRTMQGRSDLLVNHRTQDHGQRYEEDKGTERQMQARLAEGAKRIARWMREVGQMPDGPVRMLLNDKRIQKSVLQKLP